MRIGKWAAAVAIVSSSLIANVAVASATTEASISDCRDAAREVKAALASNEQSPNYAEAVKQKNDANGFCIHEMYGAGVKSYENALKLLGVSKN